MHAIKRIKLFRIVVFFISINLFFTYSEIRAQSLSKNNLQANFLNPPASARPGVYWYFMDGNLSKKGMTKDLESMKKAGISNLIFLEVNVGIPRGPVDFLSEQWQELFSYAEKEARRLGIEISLGTGPGWSGSGGPWVTPVQSMQHLVSSTIQVSGSDKAKIKLSIPAPKNPYFGEDAFTPDLKKQWNDFYADVAVLAFPTPSINKKIEDIDEKALYYRAPYSSVPGVKPYLPSLPSYPDLPIGSTIAKNKILDLTNQLLPDGTLNWVVPSGNWTVMRFGTRNNGAITRPAPLPGLGFEEDKFDTLALNAHLDQYIGKLLRKIDKPDPKLSGGLKIIHLDSWEMGAQNWTAHLREEFIKRRGYDPLPFYPVYEGNIVESLEISERFLWDLRQTAQELVLDYHAGHLKKYSHRNGFTLSIEPYDMNPTADLELGAIADIPMCEFWSKGMGFNSSFSCIEAVSIAHINGQPLVPAEAFTADRIESRKQYPGSMKEQGDWAFAAGINRFVYHTFQHQYLDDSLKPGMTMGPYGVHWDRGQTWWPMVDGYHHYITRCQYILQQGRTVADILYLTPEGAPHVFCPPSSAMTGDSVLPDRRGYNFDGCAPGQLYKAVVKDHQIVFPGGASYRIMILPFISTMTPKLLEKIRSLIWDGATVIGSPVLQSPGLAGFPECDSIVQSIASKIWVNSQPPSTKTEKIYGNGKIIWGGAFGNKNSNELYPTYDATFSLLKGMGIPEDFTSDLSLRYTHRVLPGLDIYFVSNRINKPVEGKCIFRTPNASPELWDPLTGEIRKLLQFSNSDGIISINLSFDSLQSYFIVFRKSSSGESSHAKNFPEKKIITSLTGSWDVSFDPKWGGPKKVIFDSLQDWSLSTDEGIKYYSGIAIYHKQFDLPKTGTPDKNNRLYLDLGLVKNLARIRLNGHNLGIVWTNPWKVDITKAVKQKGNVLEIEVVNLWANRLIGDEKLPDDGINNGMWPDWLLKGKARTSGRFTFTTYKHYTKDDPLMKSGLMGPVTIQREFF